MKIATIIIIASIGWLSGCTIERTIQPADSMPTLATPGTTQPEMTIPMPQPTSRYTAEQQFISGIYAVHAGPILVEDSLLIETGWTVCQGVSDGATVQDILQTADESATDANTYNLLIELSVAALVFLCPEYQYILDESNLL